jgi:DNA polymerase/3'-5' exonuclease PolX
VSFGRRLPFSEAYALAERVSQLLEPVCARSKCVGSVRRKRPDCGDIEFLVEPYQVETSLFGEREPDADLIRYAFAGHGREVKGGDRMIQYADLFGAEGVVLDLYLQHEPAEWGSLLAIRTGPAELGIHAMLGFRARGLRHTNGFVAGHPTPTEEEYFRLAGLECVPPWERDAYARRLNQEQRKVRA